MQSQSFSLDIAGKTLVAEFTDLTEKASGSVLLTMGETAILVTAVMSDRDSTAHYFPLSVEFEEKFYAAGQILGSRFMRREGRPSDEAILSARIIDRTIRPLFDQSIRQDIQVVVSVLALGDEDPDVLGVIGASLALSVSDIPWRGPVGAVRIGRRKSDGEILINPGYADRAEQALDFEVLACGKDGTINMIETAAHEVREPDVIAILQAASQLHQQVEVWQRDIVSQLGKTKRQITQADIPSALVELYTTDFKQKLFDTVFSNQAGKSHIYVCQKEFVTAAKAIDIESSVAESFFGDQIDETLHEGARPPPRRARL